MSLNYLDPHPCHAHLKRYIAASLESKLFGRRDIGNSSITSFDCSFHCIDAYSFLLRQLIRTIETEDSMESLSLLTTSLLADSLEPSSYSSIISPNLHHSFEEQEELDNLLYSPSDQPTARQPTAHLYESTSRPSYDSLMERIQQTLNA